MKSRTQPKTKLFDKILFLTYILFMLSCAIAQYANAETQTVCRTQAITTTKAIIVTDTHRIVTRGPTTVIQCKIIKTEKNVKIAKK